VYAEDIEAIKEANTLKSQSAQNMESIISELEGKGKARARETNR
jgi:hypothetical protein